MKPRIPAALVALALAGCHHGLRQPATAAAKAAPVPVTTVAVTNAEVSRPLELTGTVIAHNQVPVVPKTSGRIQQLQVDEGYRVHAGQVVAVLETPQLGFQLQQQKSGVATAEANLRQAKDNLARMTDLASQGVISDQQLLAARTQVQVAESQLKQARAGANLMQTNLDDHIVTSPVSGVVVLKNQDVGAMATPQSPIVTIAQGAYQAKLTFAERDLPAIKRGGVMALTADALPGEKFTGRIAEIAEMVDPQTRLLSCKVDVDRPGDLKIGLNVRARLDAQPHQALVLPTDALLNDGGDTVVFVEENGKARRVPVTVGVREADRAEILAGLSAGQQVIERGNVFVHDGDAVSLTTANASPSVRS